MSGRKRRLRPVRSAVLIVCEGAQTEPCYFIELRRTLGLAATVDVVIEGNTGYTDPIGLVDAAVTLVARRAREAKRSNTLAPFEEVWVVFDVEHPSNGRGPQVAPAVMQALARDIRSAVSNPSFEVWYVLHDRTTPPCLTRSDDARPVLTRCIGVAYGKDVDTARAAAAWAMPRTAVALANGARQDVFSGHESTPTAHVPAAVGTGVHRLVQRLVDMSSDDAGKRKLGLPPA